MFACFSFEKDCLKFNFLMGLNPPLLWLWTIHPSCLPQCWLSGVAKRHVLLFCTLAERNRSKTPTVLNYFINEFKETLSCAVLCGGRDQKLLGIVRVTGELNWCLLENKNPLINESYVVVFFVIPFLGFLGFFSEVDFNLFMLINVSWQSRHWAQARLHVCTTFRSQGFCHRMTSLWI